MLTSSIRYKRCNDGRAIKINVTAGKAVQMNSIVCPSSKLRLINLLEVNLIIMYETRTVIINKIISAWSWKKINCSIKGELASCRFIFPQVAISNKRYNLYIWSLNSLHFVCHIRKQLIWVIHYMSVQLEVYFVIIQFLMIYCVWRWLLV